MRKAITALVIFISVFLSLGANAAGMKIQYDNKTVEYTGEPMTVTVNGESISMPLMPIIFNDRALVPVREVFEAMDAVVLYDGNKKQIDISHDDTKISITINSKTAYVNNKSTTIPDNLTPKLINKVGESAKTMVPVRFLSETLGMNVLYDGKTRNIAISTPEEAKIISAMHSSISENQYYIKLTANCKLENVEHQIMKNPLRLVIDIHGVANNLEASSIADSNKISEIRFGYESNRSRMVIDLTSIYSYKIITTEDNSMLVSILTAKTDKEINISSKNVLDTYFEKPNIVTAGPSVDTNTSTNTNTNTNTNTGSTDKNPAANTGSVTANTQKIVVIDAGHGLQDGGANGKINPDTEEEQIIYEKNLTLSVSKKIKKNLENAGISVVMTREGDTYPTLYERADLANSLNAAMFVSIHINSSEKPEPSGTETFYCTTNDDED